MQPRDDQRERDEQNELRVLRPVDIRVDDQLLQPIADEKQ